MNSASCSLNIGRGSAAGAPYVGFGHYRRYFAFAAVAADGDGIVRRVSLNAETVRELALADDAAIAGALDGCDVLAPYPVEVSRRLGVPAI